MIITIIIILIIVAMLMFGIYRRVGEVNLYLVYMQDRLNKIEVLMPREQLKENNTRRPRVPIPPRKNPIKKKGC